MVASYVVEHSLVFLITRSVIRRKPASACRKSVIREQQLSDAVEEAHGRHETVLTPVRSDAELSACGITDSWFLITCSLLRSDVPADEKLVWNPFAPNRLLFAAPQTGRRKGISAMPRPL